MGTGKVFPQRRAVYERQLPGVQGGHSFWERVGYAETIGKGQIEMRVCDICRKLNTGVIDLTDARPTYSLMMTVVEEPFSKDTALTVHEQSFDICEPCLAQGLVFASEKHGNDLYWVMLKRDLT